MAAPARSTAHGLSRPTLSASWEGRPKIPLPRIELTVSATRLHRPIARTSPSLVVLACVVSGIASLYHKWGRFGSWATMQSQPGWKCPPERTRRIPGYSSMPEQRKIFITGGTGYMGQRLIRRLLDRGHQVRALVRSGSEKKLASGCTPVVGNALDASSYAENISPADTFIQLVGVAHPSPAKAAEFRRID